MADPASSNMTDRQRLKRLWRDYIWPQKGRFLTALLFMIVLAIATAAYTFVVKEIIDQANALREAGETVGESDALNKAKSYAWIILPILIGITLVSGLSNYIQRVLTNAITLNAVGKMQKQMYRSTLAVDYAAHIRESSGNRIAKFTNDVTVVTSMLIRMLSNLIKDLLTVIFTLAGMLWLNWMLTLVMGVFILALVPIIEITRRMRGSAKDVQEHIGVITSELKESFDGTRMIKTFGLEAHENERLGRTFDERIRRYMKLVTEQARVDPILEVIAGLAVAGVVIFGVYQVSAGWATPGSIAGVLTGLFVLAPRLRGLGTLNNAVQEGLSSLDRIYSVIDETPEIIEKSEAKKLGRSHGHIQFENVSFAYEDGTVALTEIDLEAKPGEMIALVGESGGGKSTVINLIPRLFDVSEGSVSIDGTDIRDLSFHSLRSNLALVSQHVTLFNDTVAANIGFGDLSADIAAIEKAAKAAAAHEFISALPVGYDTIIGEAGETLSGGQRQRLAIARAILRDAPILLLDEATSALDAESEAKVQKALETLSKGRTQIVIAHRLSTVKKADRIYVLEKGRIVEQGTHDSLSKKKNGIYAKLKSLQME